MLNSFDSAYHALCEEILEIGNQRDDVLIPVLFLNLVISYDLIYLRVSHYLQQKVSFKLIATELLWFIKGDTNIQYLLKYNNNIWNEWAFEKYVQSNDYHGPDMTNFGHRALQDDEFNELYKEEMSKFKQHILNDDSFAKNTEI